MAAELSVRAPNFSRTYFCHRIPPLRFEIPRIAFAIAAEPKWTGRIAALPPTEARQFGHLWMRHEPPLLGGRDNRIQFRPESFLPDITGPARDPNKNQRTPTALIAAGQGNVRKM